MEQDGWANFSEWLVKAYNIYVLVNNLPSLLLFMKVLIILVKKLKSFRTEISAIHVVTLSPRNLSTLTTMLKRV